MVQFPLSLHKIVTLLSFELPYIHVKSPSHLVHSNVTVAKALLVGSCKLEFVISE